jgi:signal peptidase II
VRLNHHQGERLPFNRFALFFALALIGVSLDLTTKNYMFSNYFEPTIVEAQQEKHWWIEGVFGIQTSTNPGALFGMGPGLSWLFSILSVVALTGIFCWLFVWRAAWDRWLTTALGLVTGGILGNLYDRLGFGYVEGAPESIRNNVRDWILFQLQGVPMFDPWPNFNIADSLLVCGAMLLFAHALFTGESSKPSAEEIRND